MSKTPTGSRCAIYTRKSSEEGLEQSFNSLHAQREACEAFVLSQRHEGWSAISAIYDDGGFSGGSMDRPALSALLNDIRAGKVDVVVVYKIDRLTRSLLDFAKIVETLDAHSVSFVSVTQAFNTTTSMGRLTLNVLLSFAQFEREVTGERIRDKIAASKKRGMWMGGYVPLGYDLKDRKLVISNDEAATVRTIFRLYAELGAVRKVKVEIDRLGLRSKRRSGTHGKASGGLLFRTGHLYTILSNRLYRGEIRHKGENHHGDHEAIVDQPLWDAVQAGLQRNAAVRRSGSASKEPSLLAGKLFDLSGTRMTPTHTVKNGKRYRYYISNNLIAGQDGGRGSASGEGLRLPAHDIETCVINSTRSFLDDGPRVLAALLAETAFPSLAHSIIRNAAKLSERLTAKVPPYELVRDLVSRVQVGDESMSVQLDPHALERELGVSTPEGNSFTNSPIELDVRYSFRRLGKVTRLVISGAATKAAPDTPLIKAVVKANYWFELLKSGAVQSITELSTREDVQRSYVSRILPLAFLAPDIAEAILDGRQPVDLSLDRLLAAMPLPTGWEAQRVSLGFSGPLAARA